ncbi:MAG: single-stranded-DNA-specific exonuclease RecJ [Phormidesmis priestleyi Ana]|uniref:Single-stranded-DNA-specific exonuclease RecJ n=1 Tax=Phormidesmis priestleyi Ana TaxID=1666911 RepID=A0A0P7ZS96_9CYAN|nr:MAG: single-stranded-DNA-specific exonuclease RecJ [Phormidesmis priestleyi Ana]
MYAVPDQPIPQPEFNRDRSDTSPIAPPTPLTQRQVPPQRWQVFPAQKAQSQQISQTTALSPLLSQVLINRGIYTPEQAWEFLDPETLLLPSPLDEFPDLNKSLDLLVTAIEGQQQILICGDYDADGMTSTALLMRSLRYLGAPVSYAIPSRMDEGYGINQRIVEDFHAVNGSVLLTVDNGIAAYEPIARARELGLTVILTDHHEVPEKIPPANAILNPKLIDETSPYRGVAGVGVAYILAVCLAQRMGKTQDLTATLLALFTLGTIADLAPLTGVNRRWVKRGLKLLPKSRIPGVQALIEVAGLSEETALKPEAIGFRLGPRINAVGRIADPQIVIDLLTTDDVGVALQRAMQCEEANKLRRQMCEIIEAQAVEWVEEQREKGLLDLVKERVLVVVQPEWHHGVIGIVASRLVERYGVPVFIATYEDKAKKEIRGSARSIPEFNVFEALQFCHDLLGRYGGHRAAGGFSLEANKLRQFKSRLSNFACQHLQPEHLKPLVTVDVEAELGDANFELYSQIDRIHPCGIENPEPVFWTANVTVVEQKVIGKTSSHLKLTLAYSSPTDSDQPKVVMKAIAWRWGMYYPLPRALDIAYKLRLNEWNGRSDIEIELVGVRPATIVKTDQGIRPWSKEVMPPLIPSVSEAIKPEAIEPEAIEPEAIEPEAIEPEAIEPEAIEPEAIEPAAIKPEAIEPEAVVSLPKVMVIPPVAVPTQAAPTSEDNALHVEFYYNKRRYIGTLTHEQGVRQLSIENTEGHLLRVQMGDRATPSPEDRQGTLHIPGQAAQAIDVKDMNYFNLIRAGVSAVEVKQKTQLLMKKDELLIEKNELLAEKDRQITTLKAQVKLMAEKITQLSAEQQTQFAALETKRQAQEDVIQGQESHIDTTLIPAVETQPDVKQQVRQAVGDGVWFCLQAASQKDFQAAYRNYQISYAEGPDADIIDYSEAGVRLGAVIEREVLAPFFHDLYDFLRRQNITEIGGRPLGPNRLYSLDRLPPLLADQWRAFSPEQLSQRSLGKEGVKVKKVKAPEKVSDSERALIAQFLSQWEHPMANCLSKKGRQAASSLDQIGSLCSIASRQEHFLYHWQYDLLRQLIVGKAGKGGLLRQIFAV